MCIQIVDHMRSGNNKRSKLATRNGNAWTRRHLLLSGVLGGSALLAGCLGDDDPADTPTPTPGESLDDIDGVHVEGQSLRVPINQNPAEAHFVWDVNLHLDTVYEQAEEVYWATHEMPIWARWWHTAYRPDLVDPDGPDDYPQLYESYEITPEVVTVTIRDDAYWSDGTPVTAMDAIGTRSRWAREAIGERLGWEAPDTPDGYTVWDGIVGYDMPDGPEGKVFEHHFTTKPAWQEAGGFLMDPGWFMFFLGGPTPRAGPRYPTHLEPFKSLVEEAIEDWDQQTPIDEPPSEFLARHVTEDDLEHFRDPGNFVSYGAWTLKEILGTSEIVLEPNEYHRYYDDINFDEVILEYSPEDSRTRSAIQSGHLDYAAVNTPPETVEAYPDTIEELTSPAGLGYTIGVDHSSAFGDVRVRQAMMYALHTPDLAQNVHPTATAPILRPGWDNWGSEAVLDESWTEQNLLTYEQDLDRAAALLEDAGFERNSNDVWEKDGVELRTEIASPEETPAFETTVSSQLAEFGIILDVRAMDEATYVDRRDGSETPEYIDEPYGGSGDFELWSGDPAVDNLAGFYEGMENHWWNGMANRWNMRMRNYYPHEAQEDALFEYEEHGWVAGAYDLWEELFIELPPVGEPDGDLEPFNAAFTFGRVRNGPLSTEDPQTDNPYYNPPHDEPHPENTDYYFQTLAWVTNWWLPGLPLVRAENQHFLNTANWIWARDLPGADNEYMWDFFGLNWDTKHLAATGKLFADPENPKPGANVVER